LEFLSLSYGNPVTDPEDGTGPQNPTTTSNDHKIEQVWDDIGSSGAFVTLAGDGDIRAGGAI
jgi:hypothetical protein